MSLILGLEPFDKKSFIVQLVGFSLLVLGNLTYNEIIEWKIFGLNKQTTKYLNRKKKSKKGEAPEGDLKTLLTTPYDSKNSDSGNNPVSRLKDLTNADELGQ